VDGPERRDFGSVRRLPSGKWQARWKLGGKWYAARLTDDDGYDIGAWTFSTEKKALRHLEKIASEVEAGRWRPPIKRSRIDTPSTLRLFADDWLATQSLKPTTREHYRRVLDKLVLPDLGDLPLSDVDQDRIERWYAGLPGDRPTYRAHAYQVLRTVLRSATRRKLIAEVPSIDGAGRSKRKRQITLLEPAEVDALAAEMPAKYAPMVLLSAWCALRYGEATALTRTDVDTDRGVLHVRRGVTRTKGKWHVSTPKSGQGRVVAIPANVLPVVKAHVDGLAPDDLLFPAPRGGYMIAPTFGKMFRAAADAIGRPDVRVHDLRHFGLTRYAMAGASLAEIMDRGGHLTVDAAQVYFNIAHGRDAEISARMVEMANGGNGVPIGSAKGKRISATK